MPKDKKIKDSLKELTTQMQALAKVVKKKREIFKKEASPATLRKLDALNTYSDDLNRNIEALEKMRDKIDKVSDEDLAKEVFESYALLKNDKLTDNLKDTLPLDVLTSAFRQIETIHNTLAQQHPIESPFSKYVTAYIASYLKPDGSYGTIDNRPFDNRGGKFEHFSGLNPAHPSGDLSDPFLKLAIFAELKKSSAEFDNIVKHLGKQKSYSDSDTDYVTKEYEKLVSQLNKELVGVKIADISARSFLLSAYGAYAANNLMPTEENMALRKFLVKTTNEYSPVGVSKEASKESSSNSATSMSVGSKTSIWQSSVKPASTSTSEPKVNMGDKGKGKDTTSKGPSSSQ